MKKRFQGNIIGEAGNTAAIEYIYIYIYKYRKLQKGISNEVYDYAKIE